MAIPGLSVSYLIDFTNEFSHLAFDDGFASETTVSSMFLSSFTAHRTAHYAVLRSETRMFRNAFCGGHLLGNAMKWWFSALTEGDGRSMAKKEEYVTITARVPADKRSEIVKEIRARGGKVGGHRPRGFVFRYSDPKVLTRPSRKK